jgi:hypothetical protein
MALHTGLIGRLAILAANHDRATVFALAVVSALTWQVTQPIVFTYDSFSYLDAAKSLSGVEGGHGFVYYRAPFTPLLLAVTRVPTLNSFTWFMLAQLCIGVLSTIILHDTFRIIIGKFSLIPTLLFLSTFFPFVQSKSIMTEQVYLLGWVVVLNGSVVYTRIGSPIRLFSVMAGLFVLALTRAQGAFVAVLVIPFFLVAMPKRFVQTLAASALLLSAIYIAGSIQSRYVREIQSPQTRAEISPIAITNSAGKMLFMVSYWDTFRYFDRAAVEPSNGPATRQLIEDLLNYYGKDGNVALNLGADLASQYEGKPDALVQHMIAAPAGAYWFAIWMALDEFVGPAKADNLFMKVTIEAFFSHPFLLIETYARNFAVTFVHADSSYVWKHRTFGPEWIGPALAKELLSSGDSDAVTPLANFLNHWFPLCHILALSLVIVTAPLVVRSPWRNGWILLLLLVLYNHASVALAATPESRYTAWAFPAYLLMLTIAAAELIERRGWGSPSQTFARNLQH